MDYYKEYEISIAHLNEWETAVLPELKNLLKVCGKVFSKQTSENNLECIYYPSDATEEELLAASKINNEILSPYTIVKRDSLGSLYAVPYSEEYSDELAEAITIAESAIKIVEDDRLKLYLEKFIEVCKNNDWEELENCWLKNKGNSLDLQFAPIEPYMDPILNIKHGFQGSLRISSDIKKYSPAEYIEIAKAIKLSTFETGVDSDGIELNIRIDDVIACGGYQVTSSAAGSNYPNNPDKVLEYGTKIIIYKNRLNNVDLHNLIPTLRSVIDHNQISAYSDEVLLDANVQSTIVHEVSEAMLKHSGSTKRLKSLYLPVRELHSSLMGTKLAAIHVLQGALAHDSYEAMLITRFIGRAFNMHKRMKDSTIAPVALEHYLRGYMVVLYNLMDSEAITVMDGIITIDFQRFFIVIDELADILDKIKSEGTEEDAKVLFARSKDFSFFQLFPDISV